MKGGTCAGGGRDGIGAQDPLRRPDGIGGGDGSDVVHYIGVVVAGNAAEADVRAAVGAGVVVGSAVGNGVGSDVGAGVAVGVASLPVSGVTSTSTLLSGVSRVVGCCAAHPHRAATIRVKISIDFFIRFLTIYKGKCTARTQRKSEDCPPT